MGFSMYLSGIHRYVQVAPLSWFYQTVYSNLWIRFGIYVLSFIVTQCMLAPPMYLMKVPRKNLQDVVLQSAPQLKLFFENEPSLTGYDRSSNQNMTLFTYLLLIFLFIVLLSMILLALNYIRVLKKNKSFLTAGTLRLQVGVFSYFVV